MRALWGTPFTEAELDAIHELGEMQELSPWAVLRQGLRIYQLIVAGTHELREINPTLMDKIRRSFVQTDTVVTTASWPGLPYKEGNKLLAQVVDTSEKNDEKDCR